MNEDEDVENHFGYSESIWKVCPRFRLVEELKHSVNPRHPVQSKDDRARNLDKTISFGSPASSPLKCTIGPIFLRSRMFGEGGGLFRNFPHIIPIFFFI